MTGTIKKFVTLKGSGVDSYRYCKRETGWSDEKIWNVMLSLFGMSLGMEARKANQILFQTMIEHAEMQRENVQHQIAAARKLKAGPRGRGRPVEAA